MHDDAVGQTFEEGREGTDIAVLARIILDRAHLRTEVHISGDIASSDAATSSQSAVVPGSMTTP